MAQRATSLVAPDFRGALLERAQELSALRSELAEVRTAEAGRLVLLAGEAGVGKTALLRRFCAEERSSVTVVWAACDAVFTPSPLGPVLDIARSLGGELLEAVQRSAAPHDVALAMMAELFRSVPVVMVLEDLHWADEATLDVVRVVVRRCETLPALLILSYRDEEVDRAHPLRLLLGELPPRGSVRRLELEPLSAEAVAAMAAPTDVDPEVLYSLSAGNPFFVTEALAGGRAVVPATVRDAVLARAARLAPEARTVLDAAAIVPQKTELWLLDALIDHPLPWLEACSASGMLVVDEEGVRFRHELARIAIEGSLAVERRLTLNGRALAALSARPEEEQDLARLAHHAEAARDEDAVLRYAPAAAERASGGGAHRESAAQYARALRFARKLTASARAGLLVRYAHECMLVDDTDEAMRAAGESIELHRELGDVSRESNGLQLMSEILWCPGRTAASRDAARDAVSALDPIDQGRDMARACAVLARALARHEDFEEAIDFGERATRLTAAGTEPWIEANAMIAVGTARYLSGDGTGRETLELAFDVARDAGLHEQAVLARANLVQAAVRHRSYDIALETLGSVLDLATDWGLDLMVRYLLAYQARIELDQGRWEEAADTASRVIKEPRRSIVPRITALTVIARVRARRGDPEVWPPLQQARELSDRSDELQALEPVATAVAEAAWLDSKPEAADDVTAEALRIATSRKAAWIVGELGYWRQAAGLEPGRLSDEAEATPWGLSLAGDWRTATERWRALGCPYEAALALAAADDRESLRLAHGELLALGAAPAASRVARKLRERGVRAVPRGPRAATRANRCGLTPREVEVLGLLAEGLSNSEIAGRLVLSPRTVGHHVSAILRKLGVGTRGEAGAEARRLGLVDQS